MARKKRRRRGRRSAEERKKKRKRRRKEKKKKRKKRCGECFWAAFPIVSSIAAEGKSSTFYQRTDSTGN